MEYSIIDLIISSTVSRLSQQSAPAAAAAQFAIFRNTSALNTPAKIYAPAQTTTFSKNS